MPDDITPAGYVTSLILSGRTDCIITKTWQPPTRAELLRLRMVFAEITSTRYADLYNWFGAWFLRHAIPTHGKGRGYIRTDLLTTIRHLKHFTLPLAIQTGMEDFGAHIREVLGQDWVDFGGRIEALNQSPPFEPFGEEEAVVLAMAQWFKHDFMTWVDPIKCPKCGDETKFSGMAEPTSEEQEQGAGRVESHRCVSCQAERRFMRVNKVSTLLKTREGRCGEFAHLFYVLLQARGIRARYIWNSEDHVWSEYWSPTLKHWVHVDSCEAEINKPLLYDQGWGKKQAFCLAFGRDGASDVSRAYISDYDGACQGRRRAKGWSERHLKALLMAHTLGMRNEMTPDERTVLEEMDRQQEVWIASTGKREDEAEEEDLHGRISGTKEWKEARGEDGQKAVSE